MNAFVKKEIRVLLPSFGFACVLALAGLFLLDHADNWLNNIAYFTSYVFCPAVVTMLALSSFGLEVSSGTFSNLLAQPISRLKIWETKIALLAITLLCVAVLWMVTFIFDTFQNGRDHSFNAFSYQFTIVILTGLVIFSGGLWTVLLLRQVAAAFWFTLLVPGALMVIVAGLFGGGETGELFTAMTVTVLGLYSLAGFFFARWLFMRAQDVQWSGGTIVMPELRGLARFKSAAALRKWRPRAALWRKEFQLHQSQFVMAIALAVLHGGMLVARHFVDKHKSSELYFVLENFWGLWLVMPLLVGCAAVAEERKLGTLEGQLCLPVKRRTQFAIKIFVVLGLSVLLGLAMPLLLEASKILPNINSGLSSHTSLGRMPELLSTTQMFLLNCFDMLNTMLPLLFLFTIPASIGLIAFYTSTLARNTLQSLAPAVLGLLATWFLIFCAPTPQQIGLGFLWHGSLAYFVGVPVMLLTLLALAFCNFKQVRTSFRMGAGNLLVLVAALALSMVMTSAVYHRVWEKLTPFEPAHGAAQLSPSNSPTVLADWSNYFSVRLPDGRIWGNDLFLNRSQVSWLDQLLGNFKLRSLNGHFYEGSNWVSMGGASWRELVGIKTDGTLWCSEKPAARERLLHGEWQIGKPSGLVRFGAETNWSSAVWGGLTVMLVKTDGTLWRWGPMDWDHKKNQEWPGFRAFAPRQLGTETNWAKVFRFDNRTCFLKNDGSVWAVWGEKQSEESITLEPRLVIDRQPILELGHWRTTTRAGHFYLGVREDGTFRIRGDQRVKKIKESKKYEVVWSPSDLRLGSEGNWLGMAAADSKVVTLKSDGTLWLWNIFHDERHGWDTDREEQTLLAQKPVRLGIHSDWLAVASLDDGMVSLAADGSLWFWPFASLENYFYQNSNQNDSAVIKPLLDISRKPQLIGNIFESNTNSLPFASIPNLAGLKPNAIPIPANAPFNVSLLNQSNQPDGSSIAWYCLTNHTAQGVALLGDERGLPYYTLFEYSYVDGGGTIHATNHNLVNFAHVRQTALPPNGAATFSVRIPAGVTNAVLYVDYLRQKSEREVKRTELFNDLRSWVGMTVSSSKSESYLNYPLPLP